MNIVYVIGYPGAGKTTVVTAALARLNADPTPIDKPLAHVRYGDVWHIGTHRPVFGGTDTLSMSVNPVARQWVHELADLETSGVAAYRSAGSFPRILIGEGDRLANAAFLDDAAHAARSTGGHLTVVMLDVPLEQARARARQRAQQAGRPEQSNAWWKGRATKVQRLAASRPVTRIPNNDGPAAINNLHQLITT